MLEFHMTLRTVGAVAFALGCFLALPAKSEEIQVKELNRGPGGLFVFDPELVRIRPGDTITFVAADKGHEVHTVTGMIPAGAASFDAKMSENATVTFTEPGVYVIVCKPHAALGMVAVIVVGDPVNIDKIDPSALPGKAKAKLQGLLEQIKRS
jgi:pseudoazurin